MTEYRVFLSHIRKMRITLNGLDWPKYYTNVCIRWCMVKSYTMPYVDATFLYHSTWKYSSIIEVAFRKKRWKCRFENIDSLMLENAMSRIPDVPPIFTNDKEYIVGKWATHYVIKCCLKSLNVKLIFWKVFYGRLQLLLKSFCLIYHFCLIYFL